MSTAKKAGHVRQKCVIYRNRIVANYIVSSLYRRNLDVSVCIWDLPQIDFLKVWFIGLWISWDNLWLVVYLKLKSPFSSSTWICNFHWCLFDKFTTIRFTTSLFVREMVSISCRLVLHIVYIDAFVNNITYANLKI